MKNILVLYFTQSGQLRDILDALLRDKPRETQIDFREIKPVEPFPFPWTAASFFDAMPESVLQVPPAIMPMPEIMEKDYDLVVMAYQPWFLSPSQPITGFLKSEWAKALNGKPVLTVIGCRNMWLNAQEKVKEDLQELGAKHAGNIVLEDKHGNLTALLTIIRWMFKGQKEAGGLLPAAGVSAEDISGSARFAPAVWKRLDSGEWRDLQEELLSQGAVELRPNLIVMEKNGIHQFPKWAKRARAKGLPGSAERKQVIKNFQRLLMLGIFVLSPITSIIGKTKTALNKKALLKEVDYFKSVQFEKGRLK
jgi:hypothetical protein